MMDPLLWGASAHKLASIHMRMNGKSHLALLSRGRALRLKPFRLKQGAACHLDPTVETTHSAMGQSQCCCTHPFEKEPDFHFSGPTFIPGRGLAKQYSSPVSDIPKRKYPAPTILQTKPVLNDHLPVSYIPKENVEAPKLFQTKPVLNDHEPRMAEVGAATLLALRGKDKGNEAFKWHWAAAAAGLESKLEHGHASSAGDR